MVFSKLPFMRTCSIEKKDIEKQNIHYMHVISGMMSLNMVKLLEIYFYFLSQNMIIFT